MVKKNIGIITQVTGAVVDVKVEHSRVRSVVTKLPFVSLFGSDDS